VISSTTAATRTPSTSPRPSPESVSSAEPPTSTVRPASRACSTALVRSVLLASVRSSLATL
jgi:hypothetical protein